IASALPRRATMEIVQQADGGGDFARGAVALNAGGHENDFQAGIPAAHDVEHVANGGAGWRRDQSDSLRITRKRAFSLGGKQAFGGELLLELFERNLQRAHALQLDGANNQLILAARFVNRDVALQQHFLPVLEQLTMRHHFATEQHAAQLRTSVLEREINMSGTLRAKIGNLTGDPYGSDLLLQQAPYVRGQFRDGENFTSGWRRSRGLGGTWTGFAGAARRLGRFDGK